MNGKGSVFMQKEEAKQTTIYLTSINCTDPKLAERLQNAFHLAYARTLNGGRPILDENAPLKFIKAWHKEKFKTTKYMMNYKEFAEAFAKGNTEDSLVLLHEETQTSRPSFSKYLSNVKATIATHVGIFLKSSLRIPPDLKAMGLMYVES
jgi:predicted transglutaminase-like protease